MTRHRIWIDCDPGLDDATALLMALGAKDQMTVEGISTIAGNVGLDRVTRNALAVTALAGRSDIPVHAGCPRPLMLPGIEAAHVHGDDGLGGVTLPDPMRAASPLHAIEAIDGFCRRGIQGEKGILVLIGPMTNAALAIVRAPEILSGLSRIVFMGGVIQGPGNAASAAEFNIAADPHAARIVLSSPVPKVMLGLDVTRRLPVTNGHIAAIRSIGTPPATVLADILDAYALRVKRPALHDPATIGWLLAPDIFTGRIGRVIINCDHGPSLGRSHATWESPKELMEEGLTEVMMDVDADAFHELLYRSISKL